MEFDVTYDNISVLEVGITAFGNEGYAVKYDFVKKVIQWRDSYMWNNNFTRSLNESDYKLILFILCNICIFPAASVGFADCGRVEI